MADMAPTTIIQAARLRGRKKEIDLGCGQKVVVRELTRTERKALDERLWEKGEDGKFIVEDKDGKPIAAGEGFYRAKPGIDVRREWLLATLTPAEAVDGLLADDVPDSLKDELFDAARTVNGLKPASELAKN